MTAAEKYAKLSSILNEGYAMSDTLPLSAKGRFQAVPILKGFAETVSREIQAWPDIISATHWQLGRPTVVDGADFYVNEEECGHIHLNGEVHLATSLDLRKRLVAAKLAHPFPYNASWVEISIHDDESAKKAIWLFKLNYDRIKGLQLETLIDRISHSPFLKAS